MELKGIRMITNLHCNNKCKFCYQKNKEKKILDLEVLMSVLSRGCYAERAVLPSTYKQYEYCTIMGGESTLLPDLCEYIKIGSLYANQTRLTTNGRLLTPTMVQNMVVCGLNGINISISTIDNEKYKKIHGVGENFGLGILQSIINRTKDIIDYRINIPLCEENCENNFVHLKECIEMFVMDAGLNVTMCEDIKGTYSAYDQFEKIGCTVKEVTDYGLILLDYKGKQIGYYTHRNNNYNETDLVITPLGTFINWDGYCEAVGMNV